MNWLDVARVVGGLVLLVAGGEFLVSGASSLARRFGMSSLVVGLTIVAAATSAPELAVSVDAVLQGQPDLAVGNVVGSNTANALLVVGLAAVVGPIAVQRRLLKLDLPFMLTLGVLLLLLCLDGRLGPLDAVVLVACFVAHVLITVRVGRRDAAREAADHTGDAEPAKALDEQLPLPKAALWLLIGLAGLVLGAHVLVSGAVGIAEAFGVSGLVIGLTIVAIGTSLPEIVSSIIAVRRGEPELVLGNVVGSNIVNIGLVLGLPALIPAGLTASPDAPIGIPVPAAVVALDAPLMIVAMLALLPAAFTGYAIARWEGAAFVALYGAYLGYVLLAASDHDALEGFTTVMLVFVLPMIAVIAVGLVSFEIGVRRGRRQAVDAPSAP